MMNAASDPSNFNQTQKSVRLGLCHRMMCVWLRMCVPFHFFVSTAPLMCNDGRRCNQPRPRFFNLIPKHKHHGCEWSTRFRGSKKYGQKGKRKNEKEQRILTVTLCTFDKLFIEISLFSFRLPIYTRETFQQWLLPLKLFKDVLLRIIDFIVEYNV